MSSRLFWLAKQPALYVALSALISQQIASATDNTLIGMSLADLMNEPVTSVSKKPTILSDSAAAITVITQSDIRRLGITSIPDALRLVPGIDVAQISATEWAVSARGFNGKFANKLLVLIDGRTVYAPESAGVFWNSQDLMLEDIDRIEVIRGPGATLWGSNAVNGVINISTKRATDTQGTLISGLQTSEPSSQWAARYGSHLGDDLYFRGYLKYLDQAGLTALPSSTDSRGMHTTRGGFRMGWNPSDANAVTLQGDVYDGRAFTSVTEVTLSPPVTRIQIAAEDNSGQNIVSRWAHSFSAESELTLQAYVDHSIQGDGSGVEYRTTYDVDLQHRLAWKFNDIVYGTGYRTSDVSEIAHSFNLFWNPTHQDIRLFNCFIQDEMSLVPGLLRTVVGVKFETSSLTANSVEPTLRFVLTPLEHQLMWAAVSRATRTPSLFELGGRANAAVIQPTTNATPILASALPNPNLISEDVLAYEVGYRYTPAGPFALDVATYWNHYAHLIAYVQQPPSFEPSPAPPHVLLSVMQENGGGNRTYGAETTLHWQAATIWQVTASFDWEHVDAVTYARLGEGSPTGQVKIRSYLDLPHAFEINASVSYVSRVNVAIDPNNVEIPAYVRADLGLVWRPAPGLTLGLWGTNLLHSEHLEFASYDTTVLTEIPRSVLGKITWSF